MGWVKEARKALAAGHQVQVRPHGGSMRGLIRSGQLVTIAPVNPAAVHAGDIVFVKWHEHYVLHLIKESRAGELLIGNNLGKVNGWVPVSAVAGKVIALADEAAM